MSPTAYVNPTEGGGLAYTYTNDGMQLLTAWISFTQKEIFALFEGLDDGSDFVVHVLKPTKSLKERDKLIDEGNKKNIGAAYLDQIAHFLITVTERSLEFYSRGSERDRIFLANLCDDASIGEEHRQALRFRTKLPIPSAETAIPSLEEYRQRDQEYSRHRSKSHTPPTSVRSTPDPTLNRRPRLEEQSRHSNSNGKPLYSDNCIVRRGEKILDVGIDRGPEVIEDLICAALKKLHDRRR